MEFDRRQWLIAAGALLAAGARAADPPQAFVCPMDPDVHRGEPGRCPKCGMALVAGLPSSTEFPLRLSVQPEAIEPGRPVELAFTLLNPASGLPERRFQVVHEKLFHLLLVSHDLEFFAHEHPVAGPDGVFRLPFVFPKAGYYRLLCDVFPEGGRPQLLVKTLATRRYNRPLSACLPKLAAEPGPAHDGGFTVRLRTEPAQPLAGQKTLLFFDVEPADGLELYLGAWAHMLAASGDLVDLIHNHPTRAAAGAVQFDQIFPRAGYYRMWVQFQRKGRVHTMRFTVPVAEL